MSSWKAGGDGKPISLSGAKIPWHEDRKGYCPALGDPCNCVSLGRDFCRRLAAKEESRG